MIIQGTAITGTTVSSSAATVAADSYFNLVALLLPGNGTNGAQNNTFLDSSTNNFTVTRNGNTTQGTFSPFSQTGWSNYFDGTGDYLQLADSTSWDLTGDFTIEMWIYKLSSPSQTFFLVGTAGSSTSILLYQNASNAIIFNTSSAVITSSTSAALNQWNHIALVRNGSGSNNITLYLNGLNVGQATNTTSFTGDASNGVRIGAEYPTGFEFLGYMSNVRIVKGTAVYTSAFTPPTAPLTAIANTSLLTCQSNRFIDNSTNAFAITVNGNTAVQAFAPFDPTAAYSAATVGGSAYFDGTGDYLTTASSSNLALASGDFTIEMWVYPANTSSAYRALIASDAYSGTTNGWTVYQNGASIEMYYSSGGSTPNIFTATSALVANAWQHLAVSRSSGTLRCFVNGVQVASVSNSIAFAGNIIYIGDNNSGDYFYNGYLSNVRIVKGTAVYTSAFTPPTAPVTAIANTQLLLNYTNAGITDAAAKNVLETVGGAAISTAQSKFGGSSMAFDGSGDYVIEPTSLNYGYGTGDFTIEFWLYLNSTGLQSIISQLSSNPQVKPHIYYSSGVRLYVNGADVITGGALTVSTWNHIAVSKSGSSTKLFINGTQSGSTYTDTNNYGTTSPLIIADYGFPTPTGSNQLNGYINDLRITKGYARYTANFTAPTTAFPTQ